MGRRRRSSLTQELGDGSYQVARPAFALWTLRSAIGIFPVVSTWWIRSNQESRLQCRASSAVPTAYLAEPAKPRLDTEAASLFMVNRMTASPPGPVMGSARRRAQPGASAS